MKLWFLKLKERLLCCLGRHDWAWYEGLSFRDGVSGGHQTIKVTRESVSAKSAQDRDIAQVWFALELNVFEHLSEDGDTLRAVALEAFQIGSSVVYPSEPLLRAEFLLRLSCYGTLADRPTDVSRILAEEQVDESLLSSEDWGIRVQSAVYDAWFRLLRKRGWDAVLELVATLRKHQSAGESALLERAAEKNDQSPAWALMARYHLLKAAEIMATFLCLGKVDNVFDVREQLKYQFDHALITAGKARDMELENMTRLLARTAQVLIDARFALKTRKSQLQQFLQQARKFRQKADTKGYKIVSE